LKATWTLRLEGEDARDYDAFVARSPSAHAMQTRAWARVAEASGPVSTSFVVVRDGPRVVATALVRRPCVARVALPWASIDRGPVVAEPGLLGDATRAMAGALRARGVLRLRLMPYWTEGDAVRAEEALRTSGWKDAQHPSGAHAVTLRLPLTGKTDAEIFAGGAREQLRRRVTQAARAGAVGRRGEPRDWARLRELHGDLMHNQGRSDKSERWWSELQRFASDDAQGALFACDFANRTVSVAAVLRNGSVAAYAWGASVSERLPFSKAVPCFVAAIRWARDAGCSAFDLGGVPPAGDLDPKRAAIATFKHLFDRTPVRLVREHAGWC
jgi:vancomycin resistance protein VanK